MKTMKTMTAAKFKATCLAVIDTVQASREAVTITKHGKPFVRLVPVETAASVSLAGFRFPGSITVVGDIVSPLHSDEENEQFFQRSLRQLEHPHDDID